MTPKSLLRNKLCVSNLQEFDKSKSFHRILIDHAYTDSDNYIKLKNDKEIKKVIICSGKVYFDLLKAREMFKKDDVVLIRIEQLYPFPVKSLVKEIEKYSKNACFFWCQEEPKNMGGWTFILSYILELTNKMPRYIGRKCSASPAVGSLAIHKYEQSALINEALDSE